MRVTGRSRHRTSPRSPAPRDASPRRLTGAEGLDTGHVDSRRTHIVVGYRRPQRPERAAAEGGNTQASAAAGGPAALAAAAEQAAAAVQQSMRVAEYACSRLYDQQYGHGASAREGSAGAGNNRPCSRVIRADSGKKRRAQ